MLDDDSTLNAFGNFLNDSNLGWGIVIFQYPILMGHCKSSKMSFVHFYILNFFKWNSLNRTRKSVLYLFISFIQKKCRLMYRTVLYCTVPGCTLWTFHCGHWQLPMSDFDKNEFIYKQITLTVYPHSRWCSIYFTINTLCTCGGAFLYKINSYFYNY